MSNPEPNLGYGFRDGYPQERPGLETRTPPSFARPTDNHILPSWQPYYGLRAQRRTRIMLSLLLMGPFAFLFAGGLVLLVIDVSPMLGILMLMFAVPGLTFVRWVFGDLWLPRG